MAMAGLGLSRIPKSADKLNKMGGRKQEMMLRTWVPALVAACLATAGAVAAIPELQTGFRVQNAGSDLDVGSYSAPVYHDWNNDGAPDLIVGEGTNGNVRIYPNRTSALSPSFSGYSTVKSSGSPISIGSG